MSNEPSHISSPYWNRTRSEFPSAEQTAAQLVAETPQAYADATAAKFTYIMVDRELRLAILGLKSEFESSESYQNAVNDYRSATLRYDRAKKAALRDLRENPEFAARAEIVDKLRNQIQDEHATQSPDFNRVLTIALMKLDHTRELTEAETMELIGNANVQAARDEMIEAYNALVAQRKQLERTVRNDSTVLDLRTTKNQALVTRVTAASYAHHMREARNIALRFAAFGQVQERYTPGWGWGSGAYGNYYGRSFRSTYYPIGFPTVNVD